jgi:flavin-binding protein dodecin
MTVIKVLRLSGHSRESWSDAVERAVVEATRLLQPITDLCFDKPAASSAMTRLDEYAATVCVAFIVEDPEVPGVSMPTLDVSELVDLMG